MFIRRILEEKVNFLVYILKILFSLKEEEEEETMLFYMKKIRLQFPRFEFSE